MQTILIAEDEVDIRQLVSFNLERESFNTLSAGDGKEALETAQSKIQHTKCQKCVPRNNETSTF